MANFKLCIFYNNKTITSIKAKSRVSNVSANLPVLSLVHIEILQNQPKHLKLVFLSLLTRSWFELRKEKSNFSLMRQTSK